MAARPPHPGVEAADTLGRRMEAVGVADNRFANQASTSQFPWMSMFTWTRADGVTCIGEDQEVWSPDNLGPRLATLDIG